MDGCFGSGATKCHYRGVAEIAFAQEACIFAETFTKGLHKGIVHLHKGLAQKACSRSLHHRKPLHKGLAHLHKRLQPGEATERHLRWVKTLSWQYFKARMGFTAQLASAPMRLRGWAGHYCNGVINYHKAVPAKVWLCERPGVVLNGLFTANEHPGILFDILRDYAGLESINDVFIKLVINSHSVSLIFSVGGSAISPSLQQGLHSRFTP